MYMIQHWNESQLGGTQDGLVHYQIEVEELLTHFLTFFPEFQNDKIPNFLCPVREGEPGVVDLLSNFYS